MCKAGQDTWKSTCPRFSFGSTLMLASQLAYLKTINRERAEGASNESQANCPPVSSVEPCLS